mmetsp:Transcript_4347/g.7421  ORF Transcript_4347/g.7421 Transcript_4347/m.7421 type:complete len:83 (-) Transcript_4347:1558-1806(-)
MRIETADSSPSQYLTHPIANLKLPLIYLQSVSNNSSSSLELTHGHQHIENERKVHRAIVLNFKLFTLLRCRLRQLRNSSCKV